MPVCRSSTITGSFLDYSTSTGARLQFRSLEESKCKVTDYVFHCVAPTSCQKPRGPHHALKNDQEAKKPHELLGCLLKLETARERIHADADKYPVGHRSLRTRPRYLHCDQAPQASGRPPNLFRHPYQQSEEQLATARARPPPP